MRRSARSWLISRIRARRPGKTWSRARSTSAMRSGGASATPIQSRARTMRSMSATATLIVRPRGWHLPEKHVQVDGQVLSGALFDFALYLANNHKALAHSGSAAYFYLPKLESHLEARLWNDVFLAAQEALGIPRGSIKATVLIETLPAAFEM